MTASQRPERVGRDALVKAVAKAIHAAAWEFGGKADEWWEEADEMDRAMAMEQAIEQAEAALGVALPLIADAISAACKETPWQLRDEMIEGYYRSARLVRSLGDKR